MVALLVGLRLTLLRNGLRRSTWRLVGLILGSLYALSLVIGAWIGSGALRRFGSVQLAGDLTITAYAVLTLGWLMLSLLVFGVDETVDPRRFALLPVPARRLVPGLFVSGLVSVPGAATVLVAGALVLTWWRTPATAFAAVLAVPLGVATCFLLSRAATAAFTQALASRRFRDFAAVVLALFGASVGIGSNLISGATAGDPGAMRGLLAGLAAVLSWTPIGWAWALPTDVAAGHWLVAGVHLVLAACLVAGLWAAWTHFLAVALCSPLEAGGSGKAARRNGLADRLYPATPTGAVAGRALRSWRRDPRYLSSLAGIAIAPIVLVVALLAQPGEGGGGAAVFAPVVFALLLGSVVAQDLSYDGSAIWTHITTGISGRVDRAGRVLSVTTVIGPLLVVMVVLVTVVTGQPEALPRLVALTVAAALTAMGVGSWAGSIWQIPAPPPGASPFAKNTGSGGLKGLLSFAVTTGLTVALLLPTAGLVVGSYWIGWLEWPALLIGVATGVLVLRAGVRLGGRRLDAHWPEVLAAVSVRD